jgi:hypothetical protein
MCKIDLAEEVKKFEHASSFPPFREPSQVLESRKCNNKSSAKHHGRCENVANLNSCREENETMESGPDQKAQAQCFFAIFVLVPQFFLAVLITR